MDEASISWSIGNGKRRRISVILPAALCTRLEWWIETQGLVRA